MSSFEETLTREEIDKGRSDLGDFLKEEYFAQNNIDKATVTSEMHQTLGFDLTMAWVEANQENFEDKLYLNYVSEELKQKYITWKQG